MPASSGEISNLDTTPRHTAKLQDDVESPWPDDLGRDVDDLDFTTTKPDRPPWLSKGNIEDEQELIEVAADESVDILGGTVLALRQAQDT